MHSVSQLRESRDLLTVNILEPVQDKREPKMDRMMLLICGSSGFADDVLAFAL